MTSSVYVQVFLILNCCICKCFVYLSLDINVPVVTCHASKQSSKMAMDGDYTPSRLNALMAQRLVARNTYVMAMIIIRIILVIVMILIMIKLFG